MNQFRTAVEQALNSRYPIERELGAGAVATVFLARDLKHDRLVAVKVLEPDFAASVGAERFLNEVRVTAGLNHPNIMPLYDSGEAGGFLYYVMPAVEGETLRQKLEREGQLGIEEALAITRALADALSHAHRHGIIHRDIKPENILLHHGVPLLADFGVARALQRVDGPHLTATGVSIGTPAYMSPEQAAGERDIGAASDVYALATVLYEMLAGDPPFSGTNVQAVVARILSEPPTSLRRIRPAVPASVDEAVRRALAKTPADRYAGAAVFAAALDTAVTAPPTARRQPVMLALLGLSVLVLVVLLAGRTWWSSRADGSLSADRLMVFPLVVPDGVGTGRTIGEDVATMIGNVLDNTGTIRWVDGWAQLESGQRDNPRELDRQDARALARAERCAWFITGRVVARGDSAEVVLSLHDVRGDTVAARGSAVGVMADAWRAGLRALNGILPTLIPGPRVDALAEWRDRDPSATASFLLGEAAFRRARFADALAHYRAAVAADSSFAIAAIRGALAATWNHRTSEAAALVQVALRQDLPPRYADIARGYDAYLAGRADSAIVLFRRVTAAEPELAIAWALLGEVYVHLLPVTTNPDSAAEAAFATAHGLDPEASDLLFHLIETRLRRGDTSTTAPLVRQFLAAGPDSGLAAQVELMDACVRGGPDAVRWQQEANARPFPLLTTAVTLAGAAAQLPCAERGFAAILEHDTLATGEADGRRWTALVGIVTSLLARRQYDAAALQIDTFVARWGYGASLYLLAAPFIDEWVARAREIARADAERYGRNYAGVRFGTRLWALGMLEAYRGDVAIAADVASQLAARAAQGTFRDTLLARSAEAHTALARGDSTRAIRLFSVALATPQPGDDLRWHEAQPMGAERLMLARLLHARGEHQRAIELASAFDSPWPSVYLLYLPMSLELRVNAASALGDARLLSQYRSRLARLHGGAGVIAGS